MAIDEDDDDVRLVQASAGLLFSIENELPKLLWKQRRPGDEPRRVHSRVRKRDLDHVIQLIEPFQGEPQLLDAKLNVILPPIVDAYLQYLSTPTRAKGDHVDLESAVFCLLYTLCKVRGHKIIVGFLNNEPKYLESVLEALERTVKTQQKDQKFWQTPYILLLWLGHLLLTPFDLISISTASGPVHDAGVDSLPADLPALPSRIARIGLAYLSSSTKAQDSAASMLVRLAVRPDVQHFRLADTLTNTRLSHIGNASSESRNIYELLGALRLISGVASAPELNHLVPAIYETCLKVFNEQSSFSLASNAVAKKLVVKIFRNVAILSLRSATTTHVVSQFVETTNVLETVIDYLLRSLGDKDTPVRYAAAKAISLIVLELEPEMSFEVIQAVLDTLKEDIPRSASKIDFSTVDALKWHGLTLALSHMLFKRSASPEQLPDILNALVSALQFRQRTAMGTLLGTNVRDAANFGLWSLSRRYTTAELLPVQISSLGKSNLVASQNSIIEVIAIQLILSACLDPAGNIRRGSSAALQELVGRHPDQVGKGISLVQIVDYQAVSLRARAMTTVAIHAADLHASYRLALLGGLFGWRGLGSADVTSREAAAGGVASLLASPSGGHRPDALAQLSPRIDACDVADAEAVHGIALAAALVLDQTSTFNGDPETTGLSAFVKSISTLLASSTIFSPKALRSEMPVSIAKLLTSLYNMLHRESSREHLAHIVEEVNLAKLDRLVGGLLVRSEESLLQSVPGLVVAIFRFKDASGSSMANMKAEPLTKHINVDGVKSALHGAGRALALGTLAPLYDVEPGLRGQGALTAISSLANLLGSPTVDWRVIGARSLLLMLEGASDTGIDPQPAEAICTAIHKGLKDYTVDERGDVGSLVRLQCIDCASVIFPMTLFREHTGMLQILQGDIVRLSLDKLDRVRLKAAQCRAQFLDLHATTSNVASVSSVAFFEASLRSMASTEGVWMSKALLEGCISCAGAGAESIMHASRHVLAQVMHSCDDDRLEQLLVLYVDILKEVLMNATNGQPALELLACLLDLQIPQRISASATFKWRNLLSTVQKMHHKSNDVPKILAAVHVYTGLADIPAIEGEVMNKLISMLKTNPYPRIRGAVAEALWTITRDDMLKGCDWGGPPAQNAGSVASLQQRYVIAGL